MTSSDSIPASLSSRRRRKHHTRRTPTARGPGGSCPGGCLRTLAPNRVLDAAPLDHRARVKISGHSLDLNTKLTSGWLRRSGRLPIWLDIYEDRLQSTIAMEHYHEQYHLQHPHFPTYHPFLPPNTRPRDRT
ncbi:unnamed protein product [Cyclocybe aegerita]|uniref:Uncharacterized protein n=1 Tax=Cyclocybe aegerita TaxID=1973307 RepID=A0A8S0WBG2_CYCAE|nr:unnamed protein product [Cyclocybe aegerita]